VKSIFNVFGSALLLVVMFIVGSVSAAMSDKAISERLAPVGKICVEGNECGSAAAVVPSGPQSPEDIFTNSCNSCHGSGIMGAPKFGDAAEWTVRLAKGEDILIQNAIDGVNAMPPRGTCASCSDDDIAATVKYILENSK